MSDGNRHDEIQGEIIHVYDGIEEADNELPLWWLFTFYGAIIFAVCYWFYYEGFQVGDSPMQAYTAELAAAAEGGEVSDELLDAMAMDSSVVASGRGTFLQLCTSCHREDAGGSVGPNLTDANWIHGGSPLNIHDTIRDGVSPGMPSWGSVLGPRGTQQIAAYIVSLRNTNVDGKEPQGEVWSPGGASEVDGDGDGASAEDETPSPVSAPPEAEEGDVAADDATVEVPTTDTPTDEN